MQTFQSALTATLSFITFCFETNGTHPIVVENVKASTEFCCAGVSTPLLLGRLRVVGSCEKSFEPQPVFSGNVGKLYSIANLEVARHDYASCAHLYIIRFLVETMHIQPNRIIAFGRSVGSGPAADLASRRPVAGLILESAFTSAFRVMTRVSILPFDKFDNLRKIKTVHCPVLIIHGTQDSVINASHGRELFTAANDPKQALWVQEANHNDVAFVGGTRYADSLKEFERLIQQHQPHPVSQGH